MIEPIGGNEMPKSFAQQIEDDENKIKRIREHQRMVRAKQAKQERNARTKKARGDRSDSGKSARRRVRRRRTADVLGWSERHHLGLRPVPRRQRGHESHRRNRPAHPQIAKVRNHNRHGSGGIANRASHRTTASPRPAAKLHAQPPAHRTPDRSAAAGSVGLARTAQPSLRWAEISDLVRNIFPTCRKYVVSSLL